MNRKIVEGTALRWDPQKLRLIVQLDDNTIGFVPADEITTYPDLDLKDRYSRAASYCIGIKLNYIVIATSFDGPLLSRKLLAEDTLAVLSSEKFHDYVLGTITGIEEKNIFVDVDGVCGICSAADLSYTYLSNCGIAFKRGQKFKFAISCIAENNKLKLSRVDTLPSKESLINSYVPGTIISGKLLAQVNSQYDSETTKSWFFIAEQTTPGIVEIPSTVHTEKGLDVAINITKITKKGLRGNYVV